MELMEPCFFSKAQGGLFALSPRQRPPRWKSGVVVIRNATKIQEGIRSMSKNMIKDMVIPFTLW
jgi:hypothetical protein